MTDLRRISLKVRAISAKIISKNLLMTRYNFWNTDFLEHSLESLCETSHEGLERVFLCF